MKKSLVVASLLIMVSISANAAKIGDMTVGLEFGALNSNYTGTLVTGGNSVDSKQDHDTTFEAIKIGKYFDFGRVSATVGIGNKKDNTTQQYYAIGYDYIFYSESKLTPFIGGTIAYTTVDADNYGIFEGTSMNYTGFNYGVDAGVIYAITKDIDFEIGARYLLSNVSSNEVTNTVSGTTYKFSGETNNVKQFYIGANYNF
ncbi:MAG: porin family protein [Helicobacteraceae bacterium]|nr:porin family protein [Helicobacteraceae bacterium]